MQRTDVNTSSKSWDIAKKYVFPAALSIGQVAGPTGSAIFATSKFVHSVTGEDDSPYHMPAIIIAASSTALLTISTRVAATFLHYQKKNIAPQNAEQNEPLRFGYQSLSLALQSIMFLSTAFSGLGAFLGAVGIIEQISKKSDDEIYYGDKTIAGFVIAAALYVVICSIVANISLPLKSARKNIRSFAHCLQDGTLKIDRNAAFTLAITLPGIACQPFQGFFSSSNAVVRIPYVHASGTVAKVFGGISATTLVAYLLATQVPAVHGRFAHKKIPVHAEKLHCLDTPLSIAVKAIGLVHAIVTGTNTFTAITSTMHEAFDADQRNPYLLTFAIGASLSLAIMQYVFGVLENFAKVKNDFYQATEANVYTQVPTEVTDSDLEAGNSSTISTSQFSLLAAPDTIVVSSVPAPVVATSSTNTL